ncbi:MAG: 23S rRNA pseudouridine(1911/1915/1917) synthase RluD [gamma proteobacterium symbiont of Bathyaustriella thionipta]|nr:23S rRNA pseudouridine(1911/1915/1917) synthase RluD [gamma proteobacterium symbiont of Bathyaustriella thionipta]MCU7951420.1 23S rRNA pseudouridine(1911/1915/1917) synthase RluD [gamma proteobacterium symbiont of Bathyaustriella thionipta]MCU7953852.1 23S rRNA pseudouridine(1911/1915/1917) synthase RluD [gamma proteobacterium symbiont of Bathyaustriella thionipta]MCU7956334.1 23S rRNA pseudouridine(1911/1915/1917) synthase RluD [gamma proteobacterium symbiont of Bathyaustriella thionipta]M
MNTEETTQQNKQSEKRQFTISMDAYGQRLDQTVAGLLPEYSRSRLQQWIKQGKILLNGEISKPKTKVSGGEMLLVTIEEEQQGEWLAEKIPLDIIFEDDSILVINKPIGLVVHPAAGNYTGTLLNALLYHCPELINVPRAGIVHRLDKDTSGLLVVAKTLTAQTHLVKQLQNRAFDREYEAIVMGEMISGGTVDEPIGRHPVHRVKMAVMKNPNNGKEAITHYWIKERYRGYTRLQVKLETGRTHQIRVHMAHINFPLVGDQVYAGRLRLPPDCNGSLKQFLNNFKRQALHARKLGLEHPETKQWQEWEVAVPDDLNELKRLLRSYTDELS